jgi:protein-disulfide isomerase
VALGRNIGRVGAALSAAAALAAVVAGCGGGGEASTTESPPAVTTTARSSTLTLAEAVARVRAELEGIPQKGFVLGEPNAPVAIIEYAGFDCTACATVHETIVPELIERYVREGTASLEFRVLTAGDGDLGLALGAYGARPQRQAWHMIQLEYLRSNADPDTPLAATETPATYAAALRLDSERWKADTERRQWAAEIQAALTVFKVAKWGETPVFLIRRIGLDVPFEVVSAPTSPDELDRAIGAALAR